MNLLIFGNGTLSVAQQERKLAVEFAELGHKTYLVCNENYRLFDVGELPFHENLVIIDLPSNKYRYDLLRIDDKIDIVLGMDQSTSIFVLDYKNRHRDAKCFCMFLDFPLHVIDGKDEINYNFNYAQRYYYWINCALYLDGIIFNNQVARDEFKKLYNRESHLVWYAISEDNFLEKYTPLKSDYIIACNRLIPYKGTEYLIDAVRRLPYKYKHIAVSGDVEKFNKLTEFMSDRVTLIPRVGEYDKMKIIADAYCLVYPQVTEYVGGLSIIEGWSVMTPGICFDYEVLKELYDDCVLYAKRKSIIDLREKIKIYYNEPDIYSIMVDKGYKRFKEFFTREIMAKNLLKVFQL